MRTDFGVTIKPTHIGDLFRGVSPSTPKVGETIVLGTGTFFTEPTDWYAEGVKFSLAFGLDPDDGRETDWLDINSLYRLHEQDVELYFEADTYGVKSVP